MNALQQGSTRVTADASGLTAEHRVVWARLGRLEALCAERSARGNALRTTTTTI
ncbi:MULTISPECIES: hypothetical protein [unclassified Curtobacterium]|uniref:hypothetical protein n=1 Tax=unclassified Curtobacterium TaxID=257496 RepID=UPI0015E8B104|nr:MULTISPECIES: hypothetical protein [unclassified Curtobacterium]WIB13418.1 hypothetical protein DEJ36_06330 [Curtobacterium sp. MCPF17_052]